MKQSTQRGTALDGLKLAFIGVVMVGLLAALLIYLPNIRASLRGTPSPRASSSPGTAVPVERDFQAADELSRSATQRKTRRSPPRQEIVSQAKTVHVLPATEYELEAAHEQARRDACEPIPAGQPREITSFSPYLTGREQREFREGQTTALSIRQHVFSVGFDMLEADRQRLPFLSGGTITRYLNDQFVTLQVRVQKDLASGVLHLHHRPLAAVASFQHSQLTQETTETLARSLRNYRSLGLFLPEGMPALPENLRTLVLLHKSEKEAVGRSSRGSAKYEFVFVRALDDQDGDSPRLKCQTYATSDERTVLHHLQSCEDPSRPESCSVKTMLHFTEYVDHGLRPVASVSRGSIFNDHAKYSMESLNQFARSQNWQGDALDNLTLILDALIEGKVAPQQ